MDIKLDEISPSQVYFSLIQAIVPRPIAWILSANRNPSDCQQPGDYNLAPFSYFTPVSSNPAVAVVSIGKKPDGSDKDTLRNLRERRHATIHIARQEQAAEVTESSRTRNFGDSEISAQGLELISQQGFSLPRLKDASIAIDAQWYDCYEIGDAPQSVVFLELKRLWVDDTVVTEVDGRQSISAGRLDPLARLGANTYAGLDDVFTIPRPK